MSGPDDILPPVNPRGEMTYFEKMQLISEGRLLPCGHPPEGEDDKIILDQCFICDWATPTREESNKLNELMAARGEEEVQLVDMARLGEHSSDETMSGLRSAEIKERMDKIQELTEMIDRQRTRVKITQEEEDVRG